MKGVSSGRGDVVHAVEPGVFGMCNATLLPDPDSPLTRMSLIADVSSSRLCGFPRVFVGFHFLVLDFGTRRSSLSASRSMAAVHVFLGGVGNEWRCRRTCKVASAFCRSFSTVRMQCTSITWSKWRRNAFELLSRRDERMDGGYLDMNDRKATIA